MKLAIQDELFEVRKQIVTLLEDISDDELNWKPNEKSWSIAQVLEHIAIVEQSAIRLIPLGLKQNLDYSQRDLPLDHWIKSRTNKVMAAESTHPSNEPKTLEEVHGLIQNVREQFLKIINEVEDLRMLEKTSPPYPHPVFGEMSTLQWAQMVPFHEERHIGQIKELRQSYLKRKNVNT